MPRRKFCLSNVETSHVWGQNEKTGETFACLSQLCLEVHGRTWNFRSSWTCSPILIGQETDAPGIHEWIGVPHKDLLPCLWVRQSILLLSKVPLKELRIQALARDLGIEHDRRCNRFPSRAGQSSSHGGETPLGSGSASKQGTALRKISGDRQPC